jgi:uncharacterized cupredoxin-like copper-binding protein|tara:strand:+ start:246 stop:746 length:501 start_codon:yes stop_codon:yes gene_type:complete
MKFLIIFLINLLFTFNLFAASSAGVGKIGDAKDVRKVVRVSMYDNYFKPSSIKVKKGQTVKFIIENKGEFVHEFNIGTKEQHIKHQPEMAMMTEMGVLFPDYIDMEKMMKMAKTNPSMKHDHGNSVLLEPGKSGEIIWEFGDNTDLELACNVPGHYEDGMVNKIKF